LEEEEPALEEAAPAAPVEVTPPRRPTKNERQRQNRKERIVVEPEECGLNEGDCCGGDSCAAVDETPAAE
jgi:hypothetical protein